MNYETLEFHSIFKATTSYWGSYLIYLLYPQSLYVGFDKRFCILYITFYLHVVTWMHLSYELLFLHNGISSSLYETLEINYVNRVVSEYFDKKILYCYKYILRVTKVSQVISIVSNSG